MRPAQEHEYYKKIDFDQLRNGSANAPYRASVKDDLDLFYFEKSLSDMNLTDPNTEVFKGDQSWCENF